MSDNPWNDAFELGYAAAIKRNGTALKMLVKEVKVVIAEFRKRHSPEFDPDCENCQPFIRLEKAVNGL